MQTFRTHSQLEFQRRNWRRSEQSIGFVPTMGNLHAGHHSLIRLAQSRNAKIVVSIFVNPTQFDRKADLETYPRTLEEDLAQLQKLDVDAVYLPTTDDLYPNGVEDNVRIHIPKLSEVFCGKYRPGHFDGVCSVLAKFFNIVQPDFAVFGRKDYQQLLIVKQMVKELMFPIDIIAGETTREADGLALSSRNRLLNAEQRAIAPHLYETLQTASTLGEINQFPAWEKRAIEALKSRGFNPEYVQARDAESLGEISKDTDFIIVLAAAWLGEIRLIDNLLVSRS